MVQLDELYTDSSKPWRDQHISDRRGEHWKPVPGYEHYFAVSDHGRIKRLQRYSFDSLGRKFATQEKIILPSINRCENKLKNDFTYRFQIQVQVEGRPISFQVQRMVYCCFVEPYDLNDRNIIIISVKDNGLDIRPKYLKRISLSEKSKRTYEQGRQQSTFLYNPAYKEHAVRASNAVQSRKVSCYNDKGIHVETFPSITEACNKVGIKHANIRYCIEKPYHSYGGFYWRAGDKPVTEILKKPEKDYRESRGSRITKFDLEGNPLERYMAISEAAKLNNVSHRSIMSHINGRYPSAGGYIWKLGEHYGKLEFDK